jgi:phage repressor protein C with HTH and peptisase S24 domain
MNDLHRLQQLIDELFNGNQAAFSRAIHRQPAQVSQYVRERRQVGVEIKQHIEKALDLPGWFECSGTVEEHRAQAAARQLPMFDSTSDYPRPNLAGLRRVPVIGTTQGGFPDRVWTDGDVPVGGGDEYADCSTTDKNAFLCRVMGSSMAPRYQQGEFCLVQPNTVPEIEDDVLVRLVTGETMLKRLLGVRGGLRLGSYNDDEIFTFADNEVLWCYYVVQPVPARNIKSRIDTQDYSGPDRRWINMPGSPKRRKDDPDDKEH